MAEPQELTNVTFDEIQVGATKEATVTLTQHQIDVAAIVSGDVDALYVQGADTGDMRLEPKKTEAAGAVAARGRAESRHSSTRPRRSSRPLRNRVRSSRIT